MNEPNQEARTLVECRLDEGHGVYCLWRYPDGNTRKVFTGSSSDPEATIEEYRKRSLPLPVGELTGKRLRVKEGGRVTPLSNEDHRFDCDAECPAAEPDEEYLKGCWEICLLGLPAGATGRVGGQDEPGVYEVVWDDGFACDGSPWSEAVGYYPKEQIEEGAYLEESK